MKIPFPNKTSNFVFSINLNSIEYIIKCSFNCTSNTYFAYVLDQENNKISIDTVVNVGNNILKTTDLDATLIFEGPTDPTYKESFGDFVFEQL